MRTAFYLFLIICISNFFAVGQDVNRLKIESIQNYLLHLEKTGFSGSVLVGKGDSIVFSGGYGYADVSSSVKNDATTVFDIGSITKQFTATAILKLEMLGKISVSDSLPVYFENVPGDKSSITLHDLLRHQSGLISNVGKDFEPITTAAFIDTVMNSKLRFPPGSSFSYSNISYSLLAIIIEKVSGQSYEQFLYENLFMPSGMEQTGYSRPDFFPGKIALGYYRGDSLWGNPAQKEWDDDAPYWHLKGNGGILSTAEDLFKWDRSLAHNVVLTRIAKSKLFHPALRDGEPEHSYYGYGWDVFRTSRNTIRYWHNGTNRIFYSDLMRYEEDSITLVMLSNKPFTDIDQVVHELSRIIFLTEYKPLYQAVQNEANKNFTLTIIDIIDEQGTAAAKEAYDKRGKDVQLLESMMRNIGFDKLFDDDQQLAVKIFEVNHYAHPGSPGPLQALAEGYMETGDKRALEYFRMTAAIDPDQPFVNAMIRELETRINGR